MPASYPISIKIFSTKVDGTDVNYATHINDLQDEVVAVESALGTNPVGGYSSVSARIAALESGKLNAADIGTVNHNALANLTVGDAHTQYLLKSIGTAKGTLLGFSAASVPGALAAPTDGLVLEGDASATYGWKWGTTPTRHASGLFSARPAASAATRTLYYATDQDKLYYSNGTIWQNTRMEGDVSMRMTLTYTLPGLIAVPSGATDYLPKVPISVPSGQTVTLTGYRWIASGGTSFTFKIQHYTGATLATVTDLATGIVAATASVKGSGTFGTPLSAADGDAWAPVVTAVSVSPTGGSIGLLVDMVV